MGKGSRGKGKGVSIKPLPWNGDHGPDMPLVTKDTVLETMDGPNRMARRRRMPQSEVWKPKLSNRQYQAAQAIENAYGRAQALGSGGDSIGKVVDLQTTVQSSPKPSKTVTAQISAVGHLMHVMSAVHGAARPVIEHLFWHQKPIRDFVQGRAFYNRSAEIKVALDLVANRLRY